MRVLTSFVQTLETYIDKYFLNFITEQSPPPRIFTLLHRLSYNNHVATKQRHLELLTKRGVAFQEVDFGNK